MNAIRRSPRLIKIKKEKEDNKSIIVSLSNVRISKKTPSKSKTKVLSPKLTPSKNEIQNQVVSPIKISIKNSPKSLTKKIKSKTPKKNLIETVFELNDYQKYKKNLTINFNSKILFREKEIETLKNFLIEHLDQKKSSSLYVSGPPGTGKTVTVNKIVFELKKKFDFTYISLNGISFNSPNAFYQRFLEELSQISVLQKDALPLIKQELSQKDEMIVLTLDEIDILNSRHNEILYNIFEWPTIKNSKIIIIGIANILNLTTTLTKLKSLNIEPVKKIQFFPYNKDQIVGIIKERIEPLRKEGVNLIKDEAITMCALKISSVSGDVRKALDIMKNCIDLLEKDDNEKKKTCLKEKNQKVTESSPNYQLPVVQIQHVNKILNQIYTSKLYQMLQNENTIPLQQQLILCIILNMVKNGKNEIELGTCHDTFLKICNEKSLHFDINKATEFVSSCHLLEAKGLISIKTGKNIRSTKIHLLTDQDELQQILKEKTLFRSILNIC